MRYFFMHPKTFKVCTVEFGRSTWEDHIDKDDFIVVKEIGPSAIHWEEAMNISNGNERIANSLENMANLRQFNESTVRLLQNAAEIIRSKK